MAITFVVANQKGGIGKTTTATTLAGILSKKKKTLLIDADPQGNCTSTYEAQIEDQATLYDVMVDSDKLPLEEAIQHMPNGDIVASDPLLSKAEKMLDGDVEGLYRLKDAVDELEGYDYIVIDTAPSLNVILYNCLIAADQVVIPVTADAYAMQGLQQLSDTIRAVQRRQNPGLSIAGLLLVKYAGRSNLEKTVRDELQQLADGMGTKLFQTAIRECVKTKEAQTNKKLLIDYAPKCTTMQDYQAFVKELLKGVKK
ncbi:MAG: ParA family protein [Roseburia sp.]